MRCATDIRPKPPTARGSAASIGDSCILGSCHASGRRSRRVGAVRRPLSLFTAVAAASGLGILGWAEYVSWRASHRALGDGSAAEGIEAVVVLGYRDRGGRANFVNRYRVRVGLRSLSRGPRESVLVLCGGSVAGDIPEADLMARYARERGYAGRILLDPTSATTQQNIENAVALIEHAGAIKIVSNSPHAAVAREQLWSLRPDLAARLVRGADYRFGEAPLLKVASAVIAGRYHARARRDRRVAP
ncbi:YdcF family protein [Microbacterium ureisolvens]|uniref:YdcF family protein n=1 Tax=Microbacterium ureisolvens TaxID=2781186 RepID=A0ABS7HX40_9MICO|nr:YdcF family protein [Microbacterium ureisolvens]